MTLKFNMDAIDKNDANKKYGKGKTYEFEDARAKEILAVKVDGKPVAAEVKKADEKKAEGKGKKADEKKADK